VGNIPYDATEEQLVEIFQEVGPVVSFRLVWDRETGKPKGYGFCEYRDAAMALSAMRNLNGHEMNGRALRVDFAERGLEDKDSVPLITPPANPVTPPGVQSEVLKILEGMSHPQLQEILIQMKNLIQKNTDHVRHLLVNNPQFSYALLQAQVILSTVTPEMAKQVLIPPTTVKPPPIDETLSNVMGSPSQRHLTPHNNPMSLSSHISAAFPPFPPLPLGTLPPQLTRPGFEFDYAPPPMSYPIAPENLGEILPEDQRLLLEQVLQLSPEQIENLPPQERMQIMHLRQTVMQLNYLGPSLFHFPQEKKD
jgi:cleavage stimulation factor subunit 2